MSEATELIGTLEATDVLGQAQAGIHHMVSAVHQGNLADALGKLAAYRDDLAASLVRSREQIEAAMTAQELELFLGEFRAGFPVIDVAPLHHDGRLVAWSVLGRSA